MICFSSTNTSINYMSNQPKNGVSLRLIQCLVMSTWRVGHSLKWAFLMVLMTSVCGFNLYIVHSQSQQPQDLINQDIITGMLSSSGDSRSYRIHIGANEFVLVRALQREMDIDLALLDAKGGVLANIDMEVDTDRAEYLGWVVA